MAGPNGTDQGMPPTFAQAPIGASLGYAAAMLSSIGTLWIAVLMLLVVADVIGRNFRLFRDLCGWAVFRSCEHGTRCCAVG
jgi:hypothetical protein